MLARCLVPLAVVAVLSAQLAMAADPISVIQSAGSGPWSATATWKGGHVPGSNVKVQVLPGHVVTYDIEAGDDLVIRSLHIAGTLTFAKNKNTRLNVGLIRIIDADDTDEEGFDCEGHVSEPAPGKPRPALLVGTPEEPIAAGSRALIRLTYVAGLDKNSCPAIVCCGGRMDFHGQPLNRTWVKLGESAAKGDQKVTLAEGVTGWRVGDQIIVTPTNTDYKSDPISEERTITAIEGNVVKFADALEYAHRGAGDTRGKWRISAAM